MIVLVARSYVPAKDKELAEEFINVCRKHTEISSAQDGCALFEMKDTVVGNELEVMFMEAWRTRKNLDEHQALVAEMPHYARLNELRTRKEIQILADTDN